MDHPLSPVEVLAQEHRELVESRVLVAACEVDVATLLGALRDDARPLSPVLRARLAPGLARRVQGWAGGPVEIAFARELLHDLDRIVGDDRPLGAAASAEAKRALLLDAYADAIHPRPAPRTLEEFFQRVHRLWRDHGVGSSALCLSGGGIRSATFGLGVLQGLAARRLLDRFDYLSTVSGGGYIGGWLSGWIHRHPRGVDGVVDDLATATGRPIDPEPRPVRRLREYSNYLTPKAGLFSVDTWTGVATYLRNLTLNWLVLLPLLAAVLMIPRMCVAVLRWDAFAALGAGPVPPAWAGAALAVVGAALLARSIVYIAAQRPSLQDPGLVDDDDTDTRTYRNRLRWWCFVPLWTSTVVFAALWGWLNHASCGAQPLAAGCLVLGRSPLGLLGGFVAAGALIHLVAFAIYCRHLRRDVFAEAWRVVLSGAVGGFLGWVAAIEISAGWPTGDHPELYVVLTTPVILTIILLTTTLFVGLMSRLMNDEDREWSARFTGWVLIATIGWITLSALTLFGPRVFGLLNRAALKAAFAALGGASGVYTLLAGWSARTAGGPDPARKPGLPAAVARQATTVVAAVFAALVVAGIAWATSALMAKVFDLRPALHADVVRNAGAGPIAVVAAVLFVVGYVMARFVNANKFSLHAMYRNRLIRAYLGASRTVRARNPFTGFDPHDNIQMYELRRELRAELTDVDPAAFAADTRPGTPAGGEVRARLQPGTRRMLGALDDGRPADPALATRLGDELNGAIYAGRCLLDSGTVTRCFPGLAARCARAGGGDDLVLLNRDLLGTACPTAVAARGPAPRQRPLHVINMALNLVGGRQLAWQERKAESFTVSALHAGSVNLGYRDAEKYGGVRPRPGISLGTAVAVSGAAASPNQGYHSSPLVTLLMTLFNVRLGWWLGNPGEAGGTIVTLPPAREMLRAAPVDAATERRAAYRLGYPANSVRPILDEAFGLTTDESTFVYLSDGGHFENLGLYEMVLRRCHVIVVSDAGCDPSCRLEDLGNAIRKVRVDFGIPITFAAFDIRRRAAPGVPSPGKYCAVGRIHYDAIDGPDAPDGVLVYVKPAVYGDEPKDVFNYAAASATFPHETTLDQWFTESQFESYRALGREIVARICDASVPPGDLTAFLAGVERYARRGPDAERDT